MAAGIDEPWRKHIITTATDFAEGSMSARYARPLCLASFSASRAAPRAPAVSPLGIT